MGGRQGARVVGRVGMMGGRQGARMVGRVGMMPSRQFITLWSWILDMDTVLLGDANSILLFMTCCR